MAARVSALQRLLCCLWGGGLGVASGRSAMEDASVRDLLLQLLGAVSQQHCLGGSRAQVVSPLQVWSQATGGQRDTSGTSVSVGEPATAVSCSMGAVSAGAAAVSGAMPFEKQKEMDEVRMADAVPIGSLCVLPWSV